MRLFCLPHAGGSAARLARVLGARLPRLDVVPLEPAGRGARWRERAHVAWDDATRDLAGALADRVVDGAPYGLLGHSVGALLAYEVALRASAVGTTASGMTASGMTTSGATAAGPAVLVVCGRNPPHRPPQASLGHALDLPDEDLFAVLVRLGGASPRAAGPLTYRTFLSAVRDDLRLAGSYPRRDVPARLAAPLVALYGRDDPLTRAEVVAEWARYTTATFEVHACRGGHFFPFDHADEVAQVLDRAVAAAAGTGHLHSPLATPQD